MGSQQYCLRWNNHQSSVMSVFSKLLSNESLVDVTLACEGAKLKAHRVVLSACSPYFQEIFEDNPCQHPVVILKDFTFAELRSLIDFIYKGEVNINQQCLDSFLKTAESLQISGLANVSTEDQTAAISQTPPAATSYASTSRGGRITRSGRLTATASSSSSHDAVELPSVTSLCEVTVDDGEEPQPNYCSEVIRLDEALRGDVHQIPAEVDTVVPVRRQQPARGDVGRPGTRSRVELSVDGAGGGGGGGGGRSTSLSSSAPGGSSECMIQEVMLEPSAMVKEEIEIVDDEVDFGVDDLDSNFSRATDNQDSIHGEMDPMSLPGSSSMELSHPSTSGWTDGGASDNNWMLPHASSDHDMAEASGSQPRKDLLTTVGRTYSTAHLFERIIANKDDSDLSELSDDEDFAPEKVGCRMTKSLMEDPDYFDNSDSEDESDVDAAVEEESIDDEAAGTEPAANVSKLKWGSFIFNPLFPDFVQTGNNPVDEEDTPSPLDYWNTYFDDELFFQFAKFTNAKFKSTSSHNLKLTKEEMKVFFGVQILTASIGYPKLRMYWKKSTRIPIISENITRDRFFAIRSNLKIVNDESVPEKVKTADHLWKLRPFIEKVLKGCRRIPRERNMAVGEQIIPFNGTTNLKLYKQRKIHPTGLKIFVLASPSGKVLDFQIYQGKLQRSNQKVIKGLGVGGQAVLSLLDTVGQGANLFFDQYVTSIPLLGELKKQGMSGTGIIKMIRAPKIFNFPTSNKTMHKKPRGTSREVVSEDGQLIMTEWLADKQIVMASSLYGQGTEDTCLQYDKKTRQFIRVQRPEVIREYNKNIGGVDLAHSIVSCHRMKSRSKKWTVRTMLHLTDIIISNCWIQYREDKIAAGARNKDILQYLDFKLRIAEDLIGTGKITGENVDISDQDCIKQEAVGDSMEVDVSDIPRRLRPKRKNPRKQTFPIPSSKCRGSAMHMPQMIIAGNGNRCRQYGCNGKTKVMCVTCKVHLCLTANKNCFAEFHKSKTV